MSKDSLGRLLLIAGVLLSLFLAHRRLRGTPLGFVAGAFLVCFCAFVLPTRVKARYIYYGLPFLIVAALAFRAWLPVLVGVLLVTSFEMTWYLWNSYGWSSATSWAGLLAGIAVFSLVLGWWNLETRPIEAVGGS